jgi:glycosyltransferase involved in cell wall biosynthesis
MKVGLGNLPMRMGYFLRDNGACGYYRTDLPFQTIFKNKAADVAKIEPGDDQEKIAALLEGGDIFHVPRLREDRFLSALLRLEKKFVIDWDDDIFNVSPLSPHYEDYGQEEYSVDLKEIPQFYKGGVPNAEEIEKFRKSNPRTLDVENHRLFVWKDGVNFDLKRNREYQDIAKRALESCSMITVTTEILAKVYREFNGNVKVLPNCVDLNLWQRLPLKPHENIRMGWFGGHSHYEDWCLIAPILPELMVSHPEVTLVLMGAKFPGTLKGIPEDRIEYHGWIHTQAYPLKASVLDLDFSIIPLRDTPFNRCKSAIKWIEMGALKIPSIASFVSPYAEMMDLVHDNGIFIDKNELDGWYQGIEQMIRSESTRNAVGAAAYETVKKHFDINTQYHQWVDAYKEVLTWESPRIPLLVA